MSTKTEQIAWRRNKTIELRSIGLSFQEIASQLQVSKATIASDIQWWEEQAKENMKRRITEELPLQYEICLSAINTVIKNVFVIMTKSDDDRVKLQANQTFLDAHTMLVDLMSNATTIDSATHFIKSKQSQQRNKSYDEDDDRPTTTTTTAAGKQSVF